MLNKSMMIKLLVFVTILVGCASSDVVTEKAKKGESSKVQEEKVADNDSSTETEPSENDGMTASQNEYTEPQQEIASSNGSQYITYDTQQPVQSAESVGPVDNTSSGGPVVEQPQVPACDDTIPYGGYTSWAEVNAAAQAELNRKVLDEGWFTGRYQVDISQTECGTVYYTYQCWVSN